MGREEMILILSLLLGKLGLANIGATKFDVEYAFHIGEYLLVWGGRSPLHICDHGLGCITLGREIFLGHLWLHFLPRGRDSVTNRLADRIGFDDVVGSIDLGEPLAFGVTDSSRLSQTKTAISVKVGKRCYGSALARKRTRTALPVAYFFSVPTTAPVRRAAFNWEADLTVVVKLEDPPPRVREPILTSLSSM